MNTGCESCWCGAKQFGRKDPCSTAAAWSWICTNGAASFAQVSKLTQPCMRQFSLPLHALEKRRISKLKWRAFEALGELPRVDFFLPCEPESAWPNIFSISLHRRFIGTVAIDLICCSHEPPSLFSCIPPRTLINSERPFSCHRWTALMKIRSLGVQIRNWKHRHDNNQLQQSESAVPREI